jgi:hypothetical protein
MVKKIFTALSITALIAVFAVGCSSGGGTCSATGDYTVTWEFTGTYDSSDDVISIAPEYVTPDGTTDLGTTVTNPTTPWSKDEVLPGCSSASMNLTVLDDGGDGAPINGTLTIYVDGDVADSADINTTASAGDILPSSGGLVVVVQ